MRLVIDAVGAKHSGAATVFTAVIDAALRSPAVDRITAFTSAPTLRRFNLPSSPKLDEVPVPGADQGAIGRILWHATGLARCARERSADAMLCLSGGGAGDARCPSTLFIQQSLPFAAEALARMDVRGRLRMAVIRQVMRRSAARSARVIVQTPTMKDWVSRGLEVPAERVFVVEPDVVRVQGGRLAPELEELRAASARGTVLLYVGNASPYKNLGILAPAMDEVVRAVPGTLLYGTFPAAHPALRSPHVRAVPFLSPEALGEAYELATALVMPSLVETVGLPMLEAAAAGTPVLAADRPYAHDVCGSAALFFDPLDPADLAAKVKRLLSEPALCDRMVREGRENVARRAAARPYDRMIEIALDAASGGLE